MPKLIEWDSLQIRVNGDKVNEIASRFRVDPIERMELQFFNGLLRIAGTIRKFISVPFEVEIHEITASGRTVRIPADEHMTSVTCVDKVRSLTCTQDGDGEVVTQRKTHACRAGQRIISTWPRPTLDCATPAGTNSSSTTRAVPRSRCAAARAFGQGRSLEVRPPG